MSITIRYGKELDAHIRPGYGLKAFVANVFFESDDGQVANDACLLICRKSFGIGRSYIAVRRKQAHQLTGKGSEKFLADTALDCAQKLWSGQSAAREQHVIMDALMDNLDMLVMHPPEGEDLNRKALDAYFEGEEVLTHGLQEVMRDAAE